MSLTVELIPALVDNYIYYLTDTKTGKKAVVDPSEAGPVLTRLGRDGGKLDFIFNTHHHFDHVGGNTVLKEETGCQVVTSKYDLGRIEGSDRGVINGETVNFGSYRGKVIEIPGHTLGHVAYWFEEAGVVFTGDTLFTLGCGRLFEGTPEQMWSSLSCLSRLPEETQIYCGHEYTQENARFAVTVEPNNKDLQERQVRVNQLREKNLPTVPATLREELATNPFLRVADAKAFAELRKRKDNFKS